MVADNDNSVISDTIARKAFALGVESMRLHVVRWLNAERETHLVPLAEKLSAPPMEPVDIKRPDGIKAFMVPVDGDGFAWRAWRTGSPLRGLGATEQDAVDDFLALEFAGVTAPDPKAKTSAKPFTSGDLVFSCYRVGVLTYRWATDDGRATVQRNHSRETFRATVDGVRIGSRFQSRYNAASACVTAMRRKAKRA